MDDSMDESHDRVADIEAGDAGFNIRSASTTIYEKSESGPSQQVTSRKLQGSTSHRSYQCVPFWFIRLWSRVISLLSRVGKWASRLQRNKTIPIVRTLKSCPRGYPRLATFLDSDESFMMYRRFGFLQSRLLLDKQDELRQLEKALDKLDRREEKSDDTRPMTRDLLDEQLQPRQKLLDKIEQKFCSYASLLDAAQRMVALNRPSKGDYTSVQNFMYNHKPLMEAEATWVDHEEDIVTLRVGREHAYLDAAIEKVLKWCHCSLLERIFGDERSRKKSSNIEVYYSRDQITRLANCIITFMVLILLIVPVYLLYHLLNDVHTGRVYAICMGILIVSTLAFSAVLSLFTRARRHEILAAAAAYCAVLVVFLGNVGPNNQAHIAPLISTRP